MKYNNLGRSGLKVSELSFGSWITFGKNLDASSVTKMLQAAFEFGVNFFDNAEVYSRGEAEVLMGQALKDFRREELVISTKIFWGGNGPNDTGLSRKHLIEGTKKSLRRLGLEYVDLLFCHRPDPNTPLEETIIAMDLLIRRGQALYWGTSEWPADLIQQAFSLAERLGCVPPTTEQPQYNMFVRRRMEVEYSPIFQRFGLGTTTWSPLASGVLTGKYSKGIPAGSRLAQNDFLRGELTDEKASVVTELGTLASEIGLSLPQLALAWCLKNTNVSSVITGASSIDQLKENLKAVEFKARLTEEVMRKIDKLTRQVAR